MDNKDWTDALREAFNGVRGRGEGKRQIKLPSGLTFGGTLECATIEISKAAMESNMQSDAAAFDGWAFVLMRWLRVPRFRLTVAEGAVAAGSHFERFTFRLDRFRELVRDVEIDPALTSLTDQALLKTASPLLNIATTNRGYKGEPTAQDSEADLEIFLCHNPSAQKRLKSAFDLDLLCRQFPVGVFNDRVAAKTRIFPGGKSAVDLIGVDKDGAVHLFELKKPKNAKVGALSELLFYLAVLEQARSRRWGFDTLKKLDKNAKVAPQHVEGAPDIKGHLLAPEFHPLIDDELLGIVSSAMASAGWRTSADRHFLQPFLVKEAA